MNRKARPQTPRLVPVHEVAGAAPYDAIVEQDDGIYLFRTNPSGLSIERIRDGEDGGRPGPVAFLTLAHEKVEPQWIAGTELVYLAERRAPDGKIQTGQALYRTSLEAPREFTTIAEYPLGGLHLTAKLGARCFFERIGTGHDTYYEDGFVTWDPNDPSPAATVEKPPADAVSALPHYLHSFSHRQGAPAVTLGDSRFSLRRLQAGNDATWAVERAAGADGEPHAVTGEHETVSCARLAEDRLVYLRGPARPSSNSEVTGPISGENTLVCHLASDPAHPVQTLCGSASGWRVSAGRANLFHLHGALIAVATDTLRIFRLE